jgi:hypothetical protein
MAKGGGPDCIRTALGCWLWLRPLPPRSQAVEQRRSAVKARLDGTDRLVAELARKQVKCCNGKIRRSHGQNEPERTKDNERSDEGVGLSGGRSVFGLSPPVREPGCMPRVPCRCVVLRTVPQAQLEVVRGKNGDVRARLAVRRGRAAAGLTAVERAERLWFCSACLERLWFWSACGFAAQPRIVVQRAPGVWAGLRYSCASSEAPGLLLSSTARCRGCRTSHPGWLCRPARTGPWVCLCERS